MYRWRCHYLLGNIGYTKPLVIGIGHKARNGKDSTAEFLKNKLEKTTVIHWADGVYEEVENSERKYPLIQKEIETESKIYYSLLDDFVSGSRKAFTHLEIPKLHKIFKDRNITMYLGADQKDPEMLQFWGTDFRRTFSNKDYWVNLTLKKIEKLKDNYSYILIPDTRFKNEVDAIKNINGVYIKVVRLNNDSSVFISTDRDPNHISEIDLDDYKSDVTLIAKNLTELEKEIDRMIAINNLK